MVAKTQPQPEAATVEEAQAQPTVEMLMQKIEALLQETKKPPIPHLTEEARVALAAPLDPKFLRQRKGSGGRNFTFADLDYLESRVAAVDPDWSISFNSHTQNVLVCTVVIHSIPRSAVAGYYVPDEYEVWDSKEKQMVSRLMTAEVSHTIVTRAQAAAERRAFAMFGLGAQLWAHNEETAADFIPAEGAPASQPRKPQAQASGQFRAPSEARINFLGDLGVPADVGSRINSWSTGRDANNQPASDVSTVINALMAARGKSKGPVSRQTWERVVKEHAPYALSAIEDTDSDEFDDEGEF